MAAGRRTTPMACRRREQSRSCRCRSRRRSWHRTARTPSRYAQWAEDKYMRALEAPQMVAAFHSGGTLEIGECDGGQGGRRTLDAGTSASQRDASSAGSPYTVMAGSVIPAVLVSGIDSDLPGPILAQVSENVFDSASGRSLLIPQGSRLIGTIAVRRPTGQQRVQIAWQRLIFPDTSSMDLPQMPGSGSGRLRGLHRSGEQPLSRDLRHGGGDESDQRGPDGRTDGGVRWRRDLRTLRLLPTQSVGDGGRDGGSGGFRAVGRAGPADDRQG